MSLRQLTAQLRQLLRGRGRNDIADDGLDRVAYTDDGSTIYVHVFANPSWQRVRTGQAYVLAFADRSDLGSLAAFRELRREAGLQLRDEIDDIVRWFDGR